jgi:MFS superfamily sulfate permease-like transporter
MGRTAVVPLRHPVRIVSAVALAGAALGLGSGVAMGDSPLLGLALGLGYGGFLGWFAVGWALFARAEWIVILASLMAAALLALGVAWTWYPEWAYRNLRVVLGGTLAVLWICLAIGGVLAAFGWRGRARGRVPAEAGRRAGPGGDDGP